MHLLPDAAPPAGTASGSAANGEEKDFNDVLLSLPFVYPDIGGRFSAVLLFA